MKGIKTVISGIFIFIILICPVKADTIFNTQYGGSNYSEYYYLNNLSWNEYYIDNTNEEGSCLNREDCYSKIMEKFNNSGYTYYSIYLGIYPPVGSENIRMTAIFFDFSTEDLMTQHVSVEPGDYWFYKNNNTDDKTAFLYAQWGAGENLNRFYLHYDTNYSFSNSGNYIFKGFYDNENDNYDNMLHVYDDENPPKIKDLIQYSSWSDYENNHLEGYTEVNLDNYEYVLLSLKDYSQANAFQTNLQVKGQIGITPIYNYGQTSKDVITGVQVQDRCNLSYSDYTSYPFYIIQSDIQNNAIYAIKECSTGSSFKFNSEIFNITYITQENVENPTITIDGKTYNVIPYGDLPSTATKNEENNYIPGESGSATDTGGLDSAIKNVQQRMSEIWNTFTYFTDFVGQIFSSLPTEVQTILLSAFTVAIILGLIKIFVGH